MPSLILRRAWTGPAAAATSLLLAAVACAPAPTPEPAVLPTLAPAATPPSTAQPAAPGVVRLVLVPEGSEARYRARELLFGRPVFSDAVGASRAVTGTVVLDAESGVLLPESKIVLDLRTLRSNETRRDRWIQGNTLQTRRFPHAEFQPLEATGLPWPLPVSGEASLHMSGDLTVHGVTRPTTWDVAATFGPGAIGGVAATRVKMTYFGMEPPRVGPVLSIEDELTLELDFRAAYELG